MPRLVVELLGGFRALQPAGQALTFPTKKAEALLAFLCTQPGQSHSREKLASLLWGETGEEQARQSLRQTLFGIRKVLGDESDNIVKAEADRLSVDPASVDVDAVRFAHLVKKSDDLASLQEAALLYKGELLEGFNIAEESFETWVTSERDRVRELALVGMSKLLELLTQDEKLDAALQTALRIVAIDPLRELAHRSLMKLYMKQRRPDAALKQFQTCAEVVRRRLGVEPEPETTKLNEEILSLRKDPKGRGKGDPSLTSQPIPILVVEDNALSRDLVKAILKDTRYSVTMAEDGAQALIELGRRPFELILLDINLPTVDGMTFLDVMRQNAFEIPTILMTAMPGDELEVRGLELGAADFIRKPVQKEVLLKRIEKALKEHAGRRRV